MYKAIILPRAKQDVLDAARWYNKKQNGLGVRFTAEVRKKVHFICRNVYASNVRYDSVRCIILDVFPFMVHFTIDERNKTIIILAVLHTSRNPEMWISR